MDRGIRKIVSGLCTVGLVMAGSISMMSGAAKKGGKGGTDQANSAKRKAANDLKDDVGKGKISKKSSSEKQASKTGAKSK